MMPGQSGAALALTALAVFAFRAGGLLLAGRVGPHSPVLAWANAVSYAMLAVYVVQTLIAPGSSLQATPTAARIAAVALAVAGFTALGRGLFQWLVVGTAAFSLGLGQFHGQVPTTARSLEQRPTLASAADSSHVANGRQTSGAAGIPGLLDFRGVVWSSRPQDCCSPGLCWSGRAAAVTCFDVLPLRIGTSSATHPFEHRPAARPSTRSATGSQHRTKPSGRS